MMWKPVTLLTCTALALVPFAVAQDLVVPTRSVVRAGGEGVVTVSPDLAHVDVGVVTQAQTAQDAAAENARLQTAVIAELRRLLGPKAEIRTISYSVTPDYRYPQQGSPVITGYTATNVVRATVEDLAQVGQVIDAAMRAGANRVQGVQFTVRNEQRVREQALREAAVQGRSSAEAMAGALGLRVVRVVSVTEESVPVVRPLMRAEMAAAAPSTPVEPGTIDVRATVSVMVEVTQ